MAKIRFGTMEEAFLDAFKQRASKRERLKRYLFHVTLLREDCPFDDAELDAMDTDEKTDAMAEYSVSLRAYYECIGRLRDDILAVTLADILDEYEGFKVHHHTVPAVEAFVEEETNG